MHKAFLKSSRDDAKRFYKTLNKGDIIPLMKLGFEDGTYLESELVLDHSEFRGNLNFGAFIDSLAALVKEIITQLKSDKGISILSNESGSERLFKIVGFSDKSGEINALMTSLQQVRPGTARASLMYMDPEQFKKEDAEPV